MLPVELADANPPGGEQTVVHVIGHCADFCARPGPPDAASIEAHGPWCQSRPCGREIRAQRDRETIDLTVDLVRPYLHGRYQRADADRALDAIYLRITLDQTPTTSASECERVYLSAGAARQLAARLIRGADQADQLDYCLNDEWRSREQQRHTSR